MLVHWCNVQILTGMSTLNKACYFAGLPQNYVNANKAYSTETKTRNGTQWPDTVAD